MQLLAELEDAPRGVYTGAIGFFSPRQTVFNVAIRTLELEGGPAYAERMGAGSGIVIDSDPADEYRECLLKAEFLTRSADRWPEQFSLIETLLWDGAYPLIELHLDRLDGFSGVFRLCLRARRNAGRARRARAAICGGFAAQGAAACSTQKAASRLQAKFCPHRGEANRIARVRFAPQRTDPADAMLYHKTTHRPLYQPAFAQAAAAGFDDVLFLNVRGEVTEGAISNVFIEKDGRWATPPVECGLLAGVYRRHLLATRPEMRRACAASQRSASCGCASTSPTPCAACGA